MYTAVRSFPLAARGIRINCLNPGPTDTPMMPHFEEANGEDFMRDFPKPIGRNAVPTSRRGRWCSSAAPAPRTSPACSSSPTAASPVRTRPEIDSRSPSGPERVTASIPLNRKPPMYVGLSKEHEALRDELRAYYDKLLTPEVEDDLRKGEGVGQVSKDIWKQMAADGWAGVGWPKEWGGKGLTPIEQFVFFDESMRAGAPVPMLTINSVAPTIMRYGSEEQKQFYVPKILKGEIHFAIGYTEPDAGTDLASLKTTAVRDGDEYVINGQKVFTSLASGADYIWLAVRTNQEVKKHKGISIIIVPTDTPGFSLRADRQLRRHQHEHHVLRRRARARRQPRRRGERGLVAHHQPAQPRARHAVLVGCGRAPCSTTCARWAQETKLADGRRVIDQEWVQINLARVHAKLEFLRLANWRVAWLAQSGAALNPADASTIKVYGTEFYMEAARLLMEVMRDQAPLQGDSPGAVLRGRVERMLRRHAHPHVRRRHQRDAARPDRDLRAQHARQPALITGSTRSTTRWTSPSPKTQEELARPRGAHPRGPHGPRST